jgi:methionyl-tRNA formyltransferase
MRVVLIAEEAAGCRVLKLLDRTACVTIEAVFASPDRSEVGSVWATADRMGCPLLPAKRVKSAEAAEELADKAIDLVLNIHSLYVVHPNLLEVPRWGAYNLHPGPLPEMAGLNVPSWAILLGHDRHGVTLHRMTAGVDEGAVAFEHRFPVASNATGLTVSVECARRGLTLVERLLETVERGHPIPARPQDLSRQRYFDRHPPDGGSIDFDRPARDVAAHVRAADYRPFTSPWGHPKVASEATEIGLVRASAVGVSAGDPAPPGTVRVSDEVRVACGDGWIGLSEILVADEVRPPASVLRDGEVLRPRRRPEPRRSFLQCRGGRGSVENVASRSA